MQSRKEEPLQHMFRTFLYAIILIIATVSIFNFIIYKGALPAMLAIGARTIGEACDAENSCYEPLQCISSQCTLLLTEKGTTCNNQEFQCAPPFACHNNLCKEKVGISSACDEKSMQVCEEGICLDGVCR